MPKLKPKMFPLNCLPVEPLVGILAVEVDGAADRDHLPVVGPREAVAEAEVPEAVEVGRGAFGDV